MILRIFAFRSYSFVNEFELCCINFIYIFALFIDVRSNRPGVESGFGVRMPARAPPLVFVSPSHHSRCESQRHSRTSRCLMRCVVAFFSGRSRPPTHSGAFLASESTFFPRERKIRALFAAPRGAEHDAAESVETRRARVEARRSREGGPAPGHSHDYVRASRLVSPPDRVRFG